MKVTQSSYHESDTKVMPYSIWVIPPEPLYTELKNTIAQLSQTYNGPIFEPHMTLLGKVNEEVVDIEEKVKKLASSIDRLQLTLGPVSFSTTYFQSVFVRVNSTATIMQLNLEAKKLFKMENNVFMPHISLLYGNHDMTVREEAVLKCKLPQSSFDASGFTIIPATPNPSEWKHLSTISIK